MPPKRKAAVKRKTPVKSAAAATPETPKRARSIRSQIAAPALHRTSSDGTVALHAVAAHATATTLTLPTTVRNATWNHVAAAYAGASVQGGGGRFYFQCSVKNASSLRLGWCTARAYEPPADGVAAAARPDEYQAQRSELGHSTAAWVWDGRASLFHGSATAVDSSYGGKAADLRSGDVLGCGVDLNEGTVSFWRNGRSLGVAFRGLTGLVPLWPIVHIERQGEVTFDFAATPAGADWWCPLQIALEPSPAQLALFQQYAGDDDSDSISGDNTLRLAADLSSDDDASLMLLAYKFSADRTWEFSREQFLGALLVYNIASLAELKCQLGAWHATLGANALAFRLFYTFLFDYLKDDANKTVLLLDEAAVVWSTLKIERRWPLFPHFTRFLAATNVKSINRDAWCQMLEFATAYPRSLAKFDANDSWPLLLDNFVEWFQEQPQTS